MHLKPIRAMKSLFHCSPFFLTSAPGSPRKVRSEEAHRHSDPSAGTDAEASGGDSILLHASSEQTATLYSTAESTLEGPGTDNVPGEGVGSSREADVQPQEPRPSTFRGPVVVECRQALYEVHLRSVLCAGGAMDHQASRVYNAVQNSSAGTVWFTR
jgi:hypothetical protein